MDTTEGTPENSRNNHFVQVGEEGVGEGRVFLSLDYFRRVALQNLGTVFTNIDRITQHNTRYSTMISGVLYDIGNGKWNDSTFSNYPTPAEAEKNYFKALKSAKYVKRGREFYHWDVGEMMFVKSEKKA